MFAKTIIGSDAFLDMPTSARLLYYDLGMRADDDGFINSPKSIMRMTGSSDDDMRLLISKKFIIPFESGIIVIKHWNINNYIQKDRYTETKYKEEKSNLEFDENKAYKLMDSAQCIQNVYKTDTQYKDTQVRLGKDSIGKVSKDISTKTQKHKYGEYQNVLLSDDQLIKLQSEFPIDWNLRIERVSEYCASTGKTYKDYLATIRNWARKEQPGKNVKTSSNPFLEMLQDEHLREAEKNDQI